MYPVLPRAKFEGPERRPGGQVIVEGKRGLSAFPNTNLEEHLKARGIETLALSAGTRKAASS